MSDMTPAMKVLKRKDSLKNNRATFNSQLQDIREFVRGDTADFNRKGINGERRYNKVYDGAAIEALENFAGMMQGFMMSSTSPFFMLTFEDEALNDNHEAVLALQSRTNKIYQQYRRPASRFSTVGHEAFLDLGSFGTSIINQRFEPNKGGLIFKSFPLGACWISEDQYGMVDVCIMEESMSIRVIEAKFGSIPPKLLQKYKDKLDAQVTVTHAVFPREDRNSMKLTSKNKPYASFWVVDETKELLRESGFNKFPYHGPRWTKMTGEIYGRSPAMKCLPDILMLQKMEYTHIKALSKMVDPPLQVPNDGFMFPIKTHPGAIIMKEEGTENIEPLVTNANLPLSEEKAQQKRMFINRCFHGDLVELGKKDIEMTRGEADHRQDDRLRSIGPMTGRVETELLSPMVQLSYNLLEAAGEFDPLPEFLGGQNIRIDYISPAALALKSSKAIQMDRYIQRLLPLAQHDPSVMDGIDLSAYAKVLANVTNTPREIIRSDDEIAEIQENRAQQEQAEQMMSAAEPATKAMKNIAEVQQGGGLL